MIILSFDKANLLELETQRYRTQEHKESIEIA